MIEDLEFPFVDGVCEHGGQFIPRYSREVIRPRRVSQSAILYRDEWHCVYCGADYETLSEAPRHGPTLTLDHVVPVVAGGEWTVGNLVVACHKCNSGKSGGRLRHERSILADVAARSRAVSLDPEWLVRHSAPNLARGFDRYCDLIERAREAAIAADGDGRAARQAASAAVWEANRPWVRG